MEFEPALNCVSSTEAKDVFGNLIRELSKERQSELIENESFILIAGAIIENSDQFKVQVAKDIVKSFNPDLQGDVYDTLSKIFGLSVSIQ